MPGTDIGVTSLSDDDPPIFRLTVTGAAPASALDSWLAERPDVVRIVISTTSSVELDSDAIASLSERHQVAIEMESHGQGDAAAPGPA